MLRKARSDLTWPAFTSNLPLALDARGIFGSKHKYVSSLATAQRSPVLVFAKVIHPNGSSRARLSFGPRFVHSCQPQILPEIV